MTIRSRRLKRKLESQVAPAPSIRRKLRSKLPRRRRVQISPVLVVSSNSYISSENPGYPVLSVDSSSCSYFGAEVSCNSSRAAFAFKSKGKSNSKKRLIGETEAILRVEDVEIQRNRRSKRQNESEVEVSESSCVESTAGVREQRSLKLKFRIGKEGKRSKKNGENEVSDAPTKSEITCDEMFSGENLQSRAGNRKILSTNAANDVVSVSSDFFQKFWKQGEETIGGKENRALELESSEVSRNHIKANCDDLNDQSTVKQCSKNLYFDSDLACTEQFSYDDVSIYSSSQETAFSDLHSEIFPEFSEVEHSDYSPSLFMDSGSQFSEGSVEETPSPTYSLFLQYRNEFSRLITPDTKIAICVEDELSHQSEFVRFEDAEDEDSYQMLRKRERRQVILFNYAEMYGCTTEYGRLVLEQRSQLVHWMVEHSCRKELRQETLFLGVTLLDRFLSRGYFKSKRNLQTVGIACLALATRIEENQPYNSVRQKSFSIGGAIHSRCEVVAMEWMVQEVLNFQCFLPTSYNFLWFYLKAATADVEMEKRVRYLAVLALSAHEQLCYWPSTVAAALVILACLEVNQNSSHKVIGTHVRSKEENLHKCIESLEWLLHYL